MDWFSFHPYLETSRLPPTFAHPRSTTISPRRLRQAARRSSAARSTGRRSGLDAPDPLRRVRRPDVARPADKRELYERGRRRPRSTRSTRRRRRATTAGAPARRLPEERRRAALLPRQRRGRARPLAVGRVLRGRHAEVEPRGGSGGRRGGARRRRSSRAAAASIRRRGGPVRRVHVLPGRSGLAAAAGRGAGGRQGRLRRGGRVVGRAHGRAARLLLRRHRARTATSSSGRSPSATRTSASSAPS